MAIVPKPAEIIKGVITVYGTSLGDYRENVADWITSCLEAGGLPMFRTRYAGLRWDGDRVLVVCYAKADEVPGGFLEDVPRGDLELMERGVGDFRPLLEKYGTPSQRAVLTKYKPPMVGIIKWIAEQAGKCNPGLTTEEREAKLWEDMSTTQRARWLSRVGVEPSAIIAASDWGHLSPDVKERLIAQKS
ncbi:hypothetical protein ES703_105190 [subsurface metagenome]